MRFPSSAGADRKRRAIWGRSILLFGGTNNGNCRCRCVAPSPQGMFPVMKSMPIQYYHAQAMRIRRLAGAASQPEVRAQLAIIANDYEEMADEAGGPQDRGWPSQHRRLYRSE